MVRARSSIAAMGFVTALTACSGGGALTPRESGMPVAAGNATRRTAALILRIRIPKGARIHRAEFLRNGKPRYVSAATQGMTIAIAGPTSLNETVGLTSASPGCSSATAGTSCTLTLSGLLPCTGSSSCYTATVATYDAVSCTPACAIPGGANELSAAQSVPFRVALGQANMLNLTLGGYPVQFTVAPMKFGFLQGDVHGLTLWGPSALKLVVEAQDADGNAIVGPGAPAIAGASSSGALSVATPSPAAPNVLTLEARSTGTPAVVAPGVVQLRLTATPPADSGAAPISLALSVTVAHSVVYVGTGGSVEEFFDENTSAPSATISGSNTGFGSNPVLGLAVDRNGTLYGAILPSSLVEAFAAAADGNVSPVDQIVGGSTELTDPNSVAVDSTGRIYVANPISLSITEYPGGAGGNSPPVAEIFGGATGFQNPDGVALDANGTLYVSNGIDSSVTEYAAGSNGDAAPFQFIFGAATGLDLPAGLTTDLAGRLYVVNTGDSTITEYAPGVSGNVAPIASISGSNTEITEPVNVVVDANGNIFVSEENYGVLEFAPGTNGNVAPIASIPATNGFSVAVVPASFAP